MVHSNKDLISYKLYLWNSLSGVMWDKPIYKTVCQRLCGTSQFIKQFVRVRHGQAVLWNRATEPRGVSHICKLKMNLISFLGWRTQAVGCDRNLLALGATLQSLGGRVFGFCLWCLTKLGRTIRERVKQSGRTCPSGDASSTLIWVCPSTPFYRRKSCFQSMTFL